MRRCCYWELMHLALTTILHFNRGFVASQRLFRYAAVTAMLICSPAAEASLILSIRPHGNMEFQLRPWLWNVALSSGFSAPGGDNGTSSLSQMFTLIALHSL